MDPTEPARCSARGCHNEADTLLVWRNPRLHGDVERGGRTKTWAACAEHRDQLADFLSRRGFLLRTERIDR